MAILIERHHDIPQHAVNELTEMIADELEQEFGLSWQWQGDKLMIAHSSASGFLHAQQGKITIKLKLGLAASLFARAIEANIISRLDQVLLTQQA